MKKELTRYNIKTQVIEASIITQLHKRALINATLIHEKGRQ